METEHTAILQKLDAQEAKIDALYTSVERTRKHLLISMWVNIVLLVLPLLIGAIVVPMVLSSYLSTFEGLL